MSRRWGPREPWDRPDRPTPRSRFERSARWWMCAYPLRWREVHGDELLGVLEDVARDDRGALPARLPRREAVGLVRAGWSLRRREHPPFGRWLAYRALNLRLPARYWWWVADDIRSPLYIVIDLPWLAAGLVTGGVFLPANVRPGWSAAPSDAVWIAVYFALMVVVSLLGRGMRRRRAWLRHIVDGKRPADARLTRDGGMAA